MRVLITGAGLIGCYTATELIDRGDEVGRVRLRTIRSVGAQAHPTNSYSEMSRQ
jgi:nucleoside-diphosphate-sugar epimerase